MIRSLVVWLVLPLAQGVKVSWGFWTSCEQFLVQETGAIEEVCARHQIYAHFEDTANISEADLIDQEQNYQILVPEDNVTAGGITDDNSTEIPDYNSTEISDYNLTGIPEYIFTVKLTQWFIEGRCDVTINGAACDNCRFCGGNSSYVSVDCSMVPGGRAVECESNDNVFYPIEGYVSVNAIDGVDEVSLNSEDSSNTLFELGTTAATGDEREESFNPPLQADSTPPMESSSYRCIAVSITAIMAVVATLTTGFLP